MQEMQHALQNLHEVKPVPYVPDAPQPHHVRQQVMMATLIISALFVAMILLGIIAQIAHNVPH
jgi:hypothetical protein